MKVAYIDASGSTTDPIQFGIGGNGSNTFRKMAHAYACAGWRVFEFSNSVRPLDLGRPPENQGTNPDLVKKHLYGLLDTNYIEKVVIVTDDCDRRSVWNDVRNHAAIVFLKDRHDVVTHCQNHGLDLEVPQNSGHHDPYTYTAHKPQEATMNTVVTTISLQRGSTTTVADIKALLAEVERVGGDDSSVVTFDSNRACWNVAMAVTLADETPDLTDESKLALIEESKTATRTRKAEIKTLLGL